LADYLKIPEVARRLDVSEPTVRRMVKGGKLPSVFVGGAYRVSEKDLEDYLESARVTPGKVQAPLFQEPLEKEAAARRRIVQGEAHFQGTGKLEATGKVIRIAGPELRNIIRRAIRGELSEDEAMGEVMDKADAVGAAH
jgi:excisionase family DNA binding protein